MYNKEEEELRNKIISIYGYSNYIRILQYIARIAELSKVANTDAYSTSSFLSTMMERVYISSLLPKSFEGYVLEDVDLILRMYDPNNNTDIGKFKLLELKVNSNDRRLGKAQEITFGLIDRMLRSSQENNRYEGFFYIRNNNRFNNKIIVNNYVLTPDEYKMFLLGKLNVEPYRFEIESYL
jgi:hypothetical protein